MKYKLDGLVSISIYTIVEADSLEEAIRISEDREIEECKWKQEPIDVWVYDEIDGEPKDITSFG